MQRTVCNVCSLCVNGRPLQTLPMTPEEGHPGEAAARAPRSPSHVSYAARRRASRVLVCSHPRVVPHRLSPLLLSSAATTADNRQGLSTQNDAKLRL